MVCVFLYAIFQLLTLYAIVMKILINKIPLLFLLLLYVTVFSQNQESVYQEVEEMISKEDNFFKNIDTKFSSSELIGNIIAEEYEGESPEERIYFINDKYYLTID